MGGAFTSEKDRLTVNESASSAIVLPTLRQDIQISVHLEDGENYLVLHDVFGVAEGPIMVHEDMLDVLQACNGVTSLQDLAASAGVETNGPEMTRLMVFLGQMDQMGYMHGERYKSLREQANHDWDILVERPAVCAGSTYPSDPQELRTFLTNVMRIKPERNAPTLPQAKMALIPHIDFRVAPHAYNPGFEAIANHPSDVVVLVGTSHYWSNDAFILTEKSYTTPLGTVATNVDLVRTLAASLPGVSSTDFAHKPEHSLELHIVCLQHLWGKRNFCVVPLLVTSTALDGDTIQSAATILRDVLPADALWIVSGDLAHVGKKFGDEVPASAMIDAVKGADQLLLDQMRAASPEGYHQEILATDYAYRICGHAPTVLALTATRPTSGEVAAYDVWEEEETQSAVSFATVLWH